MILDFLLFKKIRDQKEIPPYPIDALRVELDVSPSKYLLCLHCGHHTALKAKISTLDMTCESCNNCVGLEIRSFRWMRRAL